MKVIIRSGKFSRFINTASTFLPMLLCIALLTSSCGGGKNEINNTDRKTVLTNTAEKAVIPAFKDFQNKAEILEKAVLAFSETPDASHLEEARQKWTEAAVSWKKASVFSQGPVEDMFLSGAIDYVSVHYPNIEKAITEGKDIDNAYITSRGSSLKGLKAIEYLLFGDGSQPDKILATFSGKTGSQRIMYLSALAENIRISAGSIIEAWLPEKGNYTAEFEKADGREAGASLGVLINKLVSQVNQLKDERVGAPAGNRNNGEPQPELVEAIPSGQSLSLLRSEIQGFESLFTANNTGGIDQLLDKLEAKAGGEPLSGKIKDQFAKIYSRIDAIDQPLQVAVFEDKEKVGQLFTDLKQLQVLLEVDVVNNLGILLTFSDSDGD